MTILQSLDRYYQRMLDRDEAEPPGFSREKIGWAVVLNRDGTPVAVDDLRDTTGKRPVATLRDVPAGQKRTVAVMPNFLWDKTAYSLGVTAGEGKRTAQEHAAFRNLHVDLLADSADEGLAALRRFLETWTPERFAPPHFRPEMLDANIVFRLEGELRLIHERPAALPLIGARGGEGEAGFCLVSGAQGPIARLHQAIKNVDGAQSSGAALVSFNLPAFESWGKEQGFNAPTGQAAATRYGAALNRLLDRGSATRMRVGDATVAFWADTAGIDEARARAAEQALADLFGALPATRDEDAAEAVKVRNALAVIAEGRPVALNGVEVTPGTKVHILGLSPNAARLFVRFWLTERLEVLAANLTRHERDCRVEPLPWKTPPSINRLLVNTVAAQEKWDNIPPLLAGEVARAVLGGGPYPRTLLSNAMMRLRAGADPAGGWHAAAIRAVLAREQWMRRRDKNVEEKGETPMSLNPDHPNVGYQLGRLFALLELAQREALGRGVNATIRDKYFGAASATPASIFPLIIGNGQNHLSKIRKDRPGWAHVIERELDDVFDRIDPVEPSTLPRSLKLEQQGEFAIGYYHQRKAKLGSGREDTAPAATTKGDMTSE